MNITDIVEDVDFFYTEQVETEPTAYDVCQDVNRLRDIAAEAGYNPRFYLLGDLEGSEYGTITMVPFVLGETAYAMPEIWLSYEDAEYVAQKMGIPLDLPRYADGNTNLWHYAWEYSYPNR